MKYYSEMLNKLFDTQAALCEAEKAKKDAEVAKEKAEREKKAARAARAKEVEEALKAANDAQAKAVKLLKAFTKDYGYYHASYSTKEAEEPDTFLDFFNVLHNFLI